MNIFIASRLSNGNGLFPVEIHLNENNVTVKHPGLISGMEKSLPYSKITSVKIVSPVFGFSKIIITAYGLDTLLLEGFERRYAEEVKRLVDTKLK